MRNPGERLARAVWVVAALKLLAHLLTTGRFGYGYFVDELYFNACAKHLAWGYVDMPPFHPALTAAVKAVLGPSLFAIRVLPAVAGAALVVLTAILARDLGAGAFGQLLAAIGVAVAPVFFAMHSFSSMNAWEPLLWTGCAILLVRILDGANPRLWLAFGLLCGIGLLNKHTMALFGIGVVVGLLLTPQRAVLRTRWIWLGAAAAFFAFLPNLVWNVREGFPFFELQAAIREQARNVSLSPLAFLGQQILMLLPFTAPVWIGGLFWLLFAREARRDRALGIAYVVILALLMAANGRVYYLAPAYPMLLAAGGAFFEGLRRLPSRWRWLGPAYAGLLLLAGIVFAPLALPCLPPEVYVRYALAVGAQQPAIERHELGPLPQLFADRFGWQEMAETVAGVVNTLPPEERSRAAIFGQIYGQAGAIEMYGPGLGLPPAYSGHLAYHEWGPPPTNRDVWIVMDDDRPTLQTLFESVEYGARVEHPYSMPYEHFDVWVCRRPRVRLAEIWPRLRRLS